jgi:hypothetical protein
MLTYAGAEKVAPEDQFFFKFFSQKDARKRATKKEKKRQVRKEAFMLTYADVC